MYAPHRLFSPPPNSETRVWHYMDLFKFLSLIDRSALYFARLDSLDDPFEGEMTHLDHAEHTDPHFAEVTISLRKRIHVNCWHMNKHESAAMWKMYSHAGHGIAIQSTFARMCRAFTGDTPSVHIGMVEYRDYATERIEGGDPERVALSKRRSFEYEHELRAAVILEQASPEDILGTTIPVDLDALIEAIYLSPAIHAWQERTLRSVLEKYGSGRLLQRSELGHVPNGRSEGWV